MDESTWLLFTSTALVIVSVYAICLLLKTFLYYPNRHPYPPPYGPISNPDESGSGCVMFFILLLPIIYGVSLIYALFSG